MFGIISAFAGRISRNYKAFFAQVRADLRWSFCRNPIRAEVEKELESDDLHFMRVTVAMALRKQEARERLPAHFREFVHRFAFISLPVIYGGALLWVIAGFFGAL